MALTPQEKAKRAVGRAAADEGIPPVEMAGRVLGEFLSEPFKRFAEALADAAQQTAEQEKRETSNGR